MLNEAFPLGVNGKAGIICLEAKACAAPARGADAEKRIEGGNSA